MERKQQSLKFPLTASKQQKLRVFYKNENELRKNASEEQVFNSLGIHNRITAYRVMMEMYNIKIEEKNDIIEANRKVERKAVKQRQKIQPTEATFNIYELYKIPSYEPEKTTTLQLTNKELLDISNRISLYSKTVVNKAIKQHNNVRLYVVVNFECLDTRVHESLRNERHFVRNENLGRVDFNNFSDFNSYLIDGIRRKFEYIQSFDYIVTYGIESIDINIIKYNPLEGASYTEIPVHMKNTRSIIYIKNKDQKCFLYSLIASRKKDLIHAERVSHYENEVYDDETTQKFIYKESDFPMALSKITHFEKKNNITIHVYSVDEKDEKVRILLYRSKNKTDEVINLFYYNKHYSLIKS